MSKPKAAILGFSIEPDDLSYLSHGDDLTRFGRSNPEPTFAVTLQIRCNSAFADHLVAWFEAQGMVFPKGAHAPEPHAPEPETTPRLPGRRTLYLPNKRRDDDDHT